MNIFKKDKKVTDEDLYKKALDWYQSNNDGKREAALELFSKEQMERDLEEFRRKLKAEKLKVRKEELERVLERCKKMFRPGMLIWSDDGTDHCPNLIVSEPYIAQSKYKLPFHIRSWEYDEKDLRTVLVKTVRLSMNEPLEGSWGRDAVGLEKVLYYMDKDPSDQWYKNHIIDLDEYHKEEIEKRKYKIDCRKKDIARLEGELNKHKAELAEWEAYDPMVLNEEHIQKILAAYSEEKC